MGAIEIISSNFHCDVFCSSVESSSAESESSTDEEYGEERDQFTAQLYKFHEERGFPFFFVLAV